MSPPRAIQHTCRQNRNVYETSRHDNNFCITGPLCEEPWWCHQMYTLSALLAICAGNSPVTGEFLSQRPMTRSFDVFFDLRLNKLLSKQWWGRWLETPSRPLWCHYNARHVQHRVKINCVHKVPELRHVHVGGGHLTYWGRVTHICVGTNTNIGSDNGLSPGRRQAIIWTNAGILLIGPLGTNVSGILSEIHTFSFKKIHLKMSSGKYPFCLGLNVLTHCLLGYRVIISEHISSSSALLVKFSQVNDTVHLWW